MNKAILVCMVIVAGCTTVVLFLDRLYPSVAQQVWWFYQGLCVYYILLTTYFVIKNFSNLFTYAKSRQYNPKLSPPESSNIIYLNQEEEWYEVG